MAFDYFDHIVCVGYVLLHVVADHFSLISRRNDFFLHYTFANGCHLWAVFGVDDGCNDVTAECRTDLVQQVLDVYKRQVQSSSLSRISLVIHAMYAILWTTSERVSTTQSHGNT